MPVHKACVPSVSYREGTHSIILILTARNCFRILHHRLIPDAQQLLYFHLGSEPRQTHHGTRGDAGEK